MEGSDGFYTMKGYQQNEGSPLTSAMEDYLEMIFRLDAGGRGISVGVLSRMLHVKPPSASKMIRLLCENGYIDAEKYGSISLTDKGKAAGGYLLRRHTAVQTFLKILNKTDDELEEAEKIEHFLRPETVFNLEKLTASLEKNK